MSGSDWTEQDEAAFQVFAGQVRRQLVPMIEGCAVSLSLVPPGEVDVKLALELGLSVWLGKPIVAVSIEGRPVPEGLRRIAHRVIEAPSIEEAQGRIVEVVEDLITEGLVSRDEVEAPAQVGVVDGRACRVCGCTTERACPGGCAWVTDPEGLGDLCSVCLAGAGSGPVDAAEEPAPEGHEIRSVWAVIMADEETGDEGIPATMVPSPLADGGLMLAPLVASGEGRLESMRVEASMMARAVGREVELRRFELVEGDVEVFEP